MNRFRDLLGEPAPDPAALEAQVERSKQTAAMVKRLRDTRTARGLTPADVERDTRINRTYIEAIEEARFQDLPAPIYARGFVRSYARYLGLEPEEAVAAMPDLAPPPGLEPIAGLRRTVTPLLPAINLPIVAGIAAAAVLVLAAFLLLPRLGGDTGLDLPADGGPAATATASGAATATSAVDTPPVGATVPPFEEERAPDFTGVPRAEAERVLGTLEVTPLFVEAFDSAPRGTIFDQSPDPGADLRPGDVITLFVSQGPR